jgi:hypothetical protein
VLAIVAGLILCSAASAENNAADPMRPDTLRAVVHTAPAAFHVNAIIVSDERRIAIVNGTRIGVGDSLNGATIVAISKSEVVLELNGVTKSLSLGNSGGK